MAVEPVRMRLFHPIVPQLRPEMPGLGVQVGNAVVALPDLDAGGSVQECARRSQRSALRAALDGVAGSDVVGRIEFVKAVMAHAPKRSASASVAGIRLWRRGGATRDGSGDLSNALTRFTEWGAVLDPVWPTHQGNLSDVANLDALVNAVRGA